MTSHIKLFIAISTAGFQKKKKNLYTFSKKQNLYNIIKHHQN